ncbi:MAG: recombinase family protein, partial [Planctomycetaceae bacterium]|nr:recombinase family protein [Planctomycetaceae bacterium]
MRGPLFYKVRVQMDRTSPHAQESRMRLPVSVTANKNGRLVIVMYARFSKEEQNPRSTDDQFMALRRFLEEHGTEQAQAIELKDEAISGEQVSRPGIDAVRQHIQDRTVDLIIAEDSSRLYRNASACLSLIESAVDHGVRVICVNDRIDTADPHWQDDVLRAQQRHTQVNEDTRARIRRSHRGLWELGAAVSHCRPGYRRRATHPATRREPERGP